MALVRCVEEWHVELDTFGDPGYGGGPVIVTGHSALELKRRLRLLIDEATKALKQLEV